VSVIRNERSSKEEETDVEFADVKVVAWISERE
jgi:hypothetical protein